MTIADCTVMVVEDHEFQRSTTLQILANLGAGALLEAADAESALELFAAGRRPDVVICDLDMPGMDGIEFLRRVGTLGERTAIIIASALDGEVLRAAELTARDYGLIVLGAIPKPLTARRLLQAIGLHRPGLAGVLDPGSAGRDPWAAALAGELIGLRARPRIELSSGRLSGLEVRAHRRLPSGVDIDALATPPVDADVALALTERITEAALDGVAALGEPVSVTLALPPSAFLTDDLVDRLAALAGDREVDPAMICVAISDAGGRLPALDRLTRLRVRGFQLGFDDFGGTDATLPMLERLPLTEVKIHAGALARATASKRGAEAFAATVALLGERGLDVICDGCQTVAEWLVALEAGCRRAQGSFIGPPLSPEDVARWASSWQGVS